MKTVAIIQARLNSTRFPRKVLAKIGDKTMLQHVIDNVNQAKLVHQVVVASPHHIDFENAERYIETEWLEKNVLGRYYSCASKYEADTIVRITADCPLINADLIDMTIRSYWLSRLGYIKIAPHDGEDVEVFSFRMLQKAYSNEENWYDKEHVTPYMQRATKLSVDTPDELERVKKWISGRKPQNS